MLYPPPGEPGSPGDAAGLPPETLAPFRAQQVEARSLPASPASIDHVRDAGWRLADLWLPAVVLYRDALAHNLRRFAGWCAEHGLDHAPHGKTTMAPQLWSDQLARGAWAISAANVNQARVMRRFGVPRVLVANEVVEEAQLRWVAGELADPGFEPYCLVDSLDGLARMERALEAGGAPRPLPVLVELGVAGRRTGVRGVDGARELAERAAASRWLRLAGVEGYEGALPQRRDAAAPTAARRWLDQLVELVTACDERGLWAGTDEVVWTAGGSAYFDLVADAARAVPGLSRPVRAVVRSGCYLTHDHLSYERTSPLRSSVDPDPLRPALVAYARVLSCPEPGRALLGIGKRDVAFDLDLPVVLAVHRDGEPSAGGEPPTGRCEVVELNDHHAFCDHEPGSLAPGDVLELGLSHPCTVFDKWPLLPVVDSGGRVVDAVRTVF